MISLLSTAQQMSAGLELEEEMVSFFIEQFKVSFLPADIRKFTLNFHKLEFVKLCLDGG
jgi:hypothetical protein